MKKAISCGTKWIFCNLLLISLLLTLAGCSSGSSEMRQADRTQSSASRSGNKSESVSAQPDATFDTSEETMTAVSSESTEAEALGEISRVDLSFDYERMPTHASNQIAVWVEDEAGGMVKTLLVTSFTAARKGYQNREMALENWVSSAKPEQMSDAQLDAISSATPGAGHLTFSWELTDEAGKRVEDGIYTLKAEGTLYWESNILFSAVINTSTSQGEQTVSVVRSEPDNPENEQMLTNCVIEVLRD